MRSEHAPPPRPVTRAPASGTGELERLLAHPVVVGVATFLGERPRPPAAAGDAVRRAAVALVLRLGPENTPDELEMLLIKRATYAGDPWSGHIALPGGRREPGDASLERTAVRETWEETAIDLERDGRLLGPLDDVQPRAGVSPPLVITPFVALVSRDAAVTPSPEVADAFWVPLSALSDPAASRDVELELSGGLRRVPSLQHAGHIIWGLTERILRQFLEVAASPNA